MGGAIKFSQRQISSFPLKYQARQTAGFTVTPSQGAWTDVGGVNVPWWGVLNDPLFTDTAHQHRLPCLSYLLSLGAYRNHLPRDPHAIYSCLSLGELRQSSWLGVFSSGCPAINTHPSTMGTSVWRGAVNQLLCKGWFASEIKEASAFWKKILGHIACHFRMALQVQHFLSSAITASLCVRFK